MAACQGDGVSSKESSKEQAPKSIIHARKVPVFKDVAPVKLTTSAILRENALTRKRRDEEMKELAESEVRLRDHTAFANWRESARSKGIGQVAVGAHGSSTEHYLSSYRGRRETYYNGKTETTSPISA